MSVDVLSIYRETVLRSKPHSLTPDGTALIMGGESYPLDLETYYRSQKGTGEERCALPSDAVLTILQGPYYTLGQVWLFYQNRNAAHGKYVQDAGGKAVSFVDRKDLLAYLSNESGSARIRHIQFDSLSRL
jgi:hypothetical protein